MPLDRLLKHLSHSLASTVSLIERDGELYVRKEVSETARAVPEALDQLVTERDVLAALAGECAPRLIESGGGDRGPFLVMEYIPWPTLSDVRPENADVPRFIEQVLHSGLSALSMVHGAKDGDGPLGIVHCDLSPSNLLLSPPWTTVRILDFGLCMTRKTTTLATPGGAFRGTLMYTSPEAARGEPLSQSSDLFSLACTIVHAATGIAPRVGTTRPTLLIEAAEQPLGDWLKQTTNGVGADTLHTLSACLDPDPHSRPKSAKEALSTLRPP